MQQGRYYLLALLVLLLDRVSKLWISARLAPGESIAVWPGVLHITAHENAGAAFGLLQGARFFFLLITVVVIFAILWYLPRAMRQSAWLAVSLALILGGALGNFVDRAATGRVIDFIDVRIIHYPIFNVADSAITIGAALWFWTALRRTDRSAVGESGKE
ncbi:MAG: signal peptidase II [Hydrogenibacillus sp.]|nr:signal peptidase II [Hydrogenibacillus sp.]